MNNIHYILGDEEFLNDVKELWEGLNEHHEKASMYFSKCYSQFSFETRKTDLIRKTQNGHLRVEIAIEEGSERHVGYCISSVDHEKNGEVESIYILQSYRGSGIGEELMKNALQWMEELGVIKKSVTVAAGNETAFGFYERFGFYPRRTVLEQVKGRIKE